MKRLLMSVCILAATAGLATAQSTSTLNQNGNSQVASINQTGPNQTSVVTQKGNENKLTLSQVTDNTGPQNADVLQNGNENKATVSQSQTGGGGHSPANTATIRQVGNNNVITQSENAPDYNSGQHVSAIQKGNNNRGTQNVERGYTSHLNLTQVGNANIASQSAHGGGYVNEDVVQRGNQNKATQTGVGTNNHSTATQVGDYNTALQDFNGGALSHSIKGTIVSKGNNNYASQTLNSGNDYTGLIRQVGNSNQARQASVGDDNASSIVQRGNNNLARSSQSGDLNVADFTQKGNDNLILGIGGSWAVQLDGSQVLAKQLGNMNTLKLYQANGATATAIQNGSHNMAVINQR